MTRKKGGGRESGGPGAHPAEGYARGTPAADPAARPYHATHTCDETEEHIRALEARLESQDRLRRSARSECQDLTRKRDALEARVKELDAMLYEMRSQRDYGIAVLLYELRSQRDYAIAIQEDRER